MPFKFASIQVHDRNMKLDMHILWHIDMHMHKGRDKEANTSTDTEMGIDIHRFGFQISIKTKSDILH